MVSVNSKIQEGIKHTKISFKILMSYYIEKNTKKDANTDELNLKTQ